MFDFVQVLRKMLMEERGNRLFIGGGTQIITLEASDERNIVIDRNVCRL